VIDVTAVRLFLLVVAGWLDRRERDAIAYLVEENRLLHRQVGARRLRLTDADRRRLAALAHRLGRRVVRGVATVVTPDTLLRWHRQLIAQKWTSVRRRPSRRGVFRILKVAGLPPVPERPTSWQTFLNAHWGVIAGADFFTTEVWTWRGRVTYYTVFVIDLASRRVQILGSTPHPEAIFIQQVVRQLTLADEGLLEPGHVLICDRDSKCSPEVRRVLRDAGVRVLVTPIRAPNAHAYAERFVRSDQGRVPESTDPHWGAPFPASGREFVEHYHRERNHQGLGNTLIVAPLAMNVAGRVRRRPRLGGLLNYFQRAA
jgi:transposase InsO family protein